MVTLIRFRICPSEFVKFGLDSTVILPITTNVKNDAFPLRIRIPKGTCGLTKISDVLVDQILAWDNSLFREDLGEISEYLRAKVKNAIKDFLDLY